MVEILLLLVALAQAQAPAQTFKSGTQVVQVDVRVVDRNGRLITDLTTDDFQLMEDGAVQRIQSATFIDQRPGAAVTAAAAPAVWLFFFDTNHLSGTEIQRTR